MAYPLEYHRNLPHLQPWDNTFFVTARLAGSLPVSVIKELEELRRVLKVRRDPRMHSRLFKYFDDQLDGGSHGPTWLRDPAIGSLVLEELKSLPSTFKLHAACFMPNHFHALVTVHEGEKTLSEGLRSAKGRSARFCNLALQQTGVKFWQRESYDHVVREGQYLPILFYILMNPVKAGLVSRWQDWPLTFVDPSEDVSDELMELVRGKGLA